MNQIAEKETALFSNLLEEYKTYIENKIAEKVETLGIKTHARDACAYALLNGGKRLRPILVLMMAKSLGKGKDATESALAIEFFHTASLVADDLPSMDDDDSRRNKPSVHKVYGEALALLASYGLIAAGYGCIATNAQQQKNEKICALALENATFNTGLLGATGGQFLDIFPPDLSEKTVKEVIHKKTTSLFEIAFVFGWLFGGGDERKLEMVKKAASHFGMAFQLADDIDDIEQDAGKEQKVNYAVIFGKEAALRLFHEEINLFEKELEALSVEMSEWKALLEYMLCL